MPLCGCWRSAWVCVCECCRGIVLHGWCNNWTRWTHNRSRLGFKNIIHCDAICRRVPHSWCGCDALWLRSIPFQCGCVCLVNDIVRTCFLCLPYFDLFCLLTVYRWRCTPPLLRLFLLHFLGSRINKSILFNSKQQINPTDSPITSASNIYLYTTHSLANTNTYCNPNSIFRLTIRHQQQNNNNTTSRGHRFDETAGRWRRRRILHLLSLSFIFRFVAITRTIGDGVRQLQQQHLTANTQRTQGHLRTSAWCSCCQ